MDSKEITVRRSDSTVCNNGWNTINWNDSKWKDIQPPACVSHYININESFNAISCYQDITIQLIHNSTLPFQIKLCSSAGSVTNYIDESWGFSHLNVKSGLYKNKKTLFFVLFCVIV